jgi:hypothetical protein
VDAQAFWVDLIFDLMLALMLALQLQILES